MNSIVKNHFQILKPSSVLDTSLPKISYVKLDLSVNNLDLKALDLSSSSELGNYINNYKFKNKAKVAYGGYLEKRDIYNRSSHFELKSLDSKRNIHLGIDLWLGAGSPIYTPLAGKVHSFRNNTNYGDYGPTIILEHSLTHQKFYTLYGHLNLASIENLEVNQKLEQGAKFAALGDSKVNGDYAPHLHFQLIRDLQGSYGDYPGVCSEKDFEFYRNNCPDPNLILKL